MCDVYDVILCKIFVTLRIAYNKKKIQIFGMNNSFISSREGRMSSISGLVKRENVYFMSGFSLHSMKLMAYSLKQKCLSSMLYISNVNVNLLCIHIII